LPTSNVKACAEIRVRLKGEFEAFRPTSLNSKEPSLLWPSWFYSDEAMNPWLPKSWNWTFCPPRSRSKALAEAPAVRAAVAAAAVVRFIGVWDWLVRILNGDVP